MLSPEPVPPITLGFMNQPPAQTDSDDDNDSDEPDVDPGLFDYE